MKDFSKIVQVALFILILAVGLGSFLSYRLLASQILGLQQNVQSIATGQKSQAASSSGPEPGSVTVAVDVVPDATAPGIGDPNAKVTLIEFADFQCPFCDEFFKTVEPQIMLNYVNTGRVRFVFENFAILGNESTDAANAAKCAQDQGKFWQYHDYLYSHQNGENQGAFSIANLKKFGRSIAGLNLTQFNSCIDASTHAKEVSAEVATGLKYGVNATPTTFINGKETIGAYQYQTYQQQIDAALNGK